MMTYKAKLTLRFDSEWQSTGRTYDDIMIPEQHLTLECPVDDYNSSQLFQTFANFAMAMGYSELNVMRGACHVAFNEMRSNDYIEKVAHEHDLYTADEFSAQINLFRTNAEEWEKRYWEYKRNAEKEILDLKAKISRLKNPDFPQYTDEEIEAMCAENHD